MSKFKKGDRVRVVSAQREAYWYSEKIGKVYTLKGYAWDFGWEVEERPRSCLREEDIELVQENKMKFDMKTQPWFIRVNSKEEFEVAKAWVIFQVGEKFYPDFTNYFNNIKGFANCYDGRLLGRVAWYNEGHIQEAVKIGVKEIKLTFKTVVDSVEWPEVETEAQKELAKLQQQIEELSAQAEKLKASL